MRSYCRGGFVGSFSSVEDFGTYLSVDRPIIEDADEFVALRVGNDRYIFEVVVTHSFEDLIERRFGDRLIFEWFGYIAGEEPAGEIAIGEHFLDAADRDFSGNAAPAVNNRIIDTVACAEDLQYLGQQHILGDFCGFGFHNIADFGLPNRWLRRPGGAGKYPYIF